MSPRISLVALAIAIGLLAIGCSSPNSTPPGPGDAAPATADGAATTPGAEPEPASAAPQESSPERRFTVVTDQKVSTITWTAVKNGDAKVVGQFTEITGGLFLDPADLSKLSGNLEANLSAIDSKNPVRDANISELLFGVVASKTTLGGIVIEAVAPEKTILAVGESTPATVSYSLGLPYGESAGEAAVTLSHPKEGRWAVSSTSPIKTSINRN